MDKNTQPSGGRVASGLARGVRVRMMIAMPALTVLALLLPFALMQWGNIDLLDSLSKTGIPLSEVYLAVGAGIMVSFLFGLGLAYALLKPLKRLEDLGQKVASGEDISMEMLQEFKRAPGELSEIGLSFASTLLEIGQYSKDRMRHIIDSLVAGVLVVNANGCVTAANRTAMAMLGYDRPITDVSGLEEWDVLNTCEPLRRLYHAVCTDDNADVEEIVPMLCADRLVACDPQNRVLLPPHDKVQIKVRALTGNDGRSQGFLFLLNDLTRQEMFLKHMQLTEDLAMLGTFARGLAHEIKNPVATIRLRSQLLMEEIQAMPAALADEALRTGMSDHVGMIETQTRRLDDLVNDVRDYVRAASQDVPENAVRFNLLQVITECVNESQQRIQAGNNYSVTHKPAIIMEFNGLDAVPVCGSEDRIRQVILNLLNNAVRHVSDNGLIRVTVVVQPGDDARGEGNLPITVHVFNNGELISQQDMPRLFHPFFTTSPSGSGIGLPISQIIVRAHGGVLTHENRTDGVEFSIHLPAPAC